MCSVHTGIIVMTRKKLTVIKYKKLTRIIWSLYLEASRHKSSYIIRFNLTMNTLGFNLLKIKVQICTKIKLALQHPVIRNGK